MISFRHRSNVKRIKIKTHKRLDERMSFWLQKVFNIKNPIIGFKSIDSKFSLTQINITMSKLFTC